MNIPLRKYFRASVLKEKAYHLSSYPEAIKLNQNELPYDLSPELKRELFRRLEAVPLQRYPLPQPQRLRERLAKALRMKASQIAVSNGSNVMIQALIAASAIEGRVMVLDPTFSVYEIEAKLFGAAVVPFALDPEDFSLDPRRFLAELKKRKPSLVFIPNPNAPTGNLFPKQDLLKIVAASPGLVVIDEAYSQFSKASLLGEIRRLPNLVILRTFSKGYGLGGARLGYAVAQEPVAEQINKILLPYCVSSLAEEAALFALDHEEHFRRIIREVLAERERMYQAMRKIPKIRVYPSKANFILFKTDDSRACFEHLLKSGILIRNVENHGLLKGCLRVSVGQPRENEAFLEALRNL